MEKWLELGNVWTQAGQISFLSFTFKSKSINKRFLVYITGTYLLVDQDNWATDLKEMGIQKTPKNNELQEFG